MQFRLVQKSTILVDHEWPLYAVCYTGILNPPWKFELLWHCILCLWQCSFLV